MLRIITFLLILLPHLTYAQKYEHLFRELQTYLQNMDKMILDFKQTDNDGKHSKGQFMFAKPNDFRWNYFAPSPILIVGNKSYISLYDYELEQISRLDSKDNIFNFLLRDDEMDEKFEILEIYQKDMQNHFLIKHKEYQHRIMIITSIKPLKLRKIMVIEPDSVTTTIEFSNIQRVKSFDKELFTIKNPDVYGPPARLNAIKLQKKYQFAH